MDQTLNSDELIVALYIGLNTEYKSLQEKFGVICQFFVIWCYICFIKILYVQFLWVYYFTCVFCIVKIRNYVGRLSSIMYKRYGNYIGTESSN